MCLSSYKMLLNDADRLIDEFELTLVHASEYSRRSNGWNQIKASFRCWLGQAMEVLISLP